MAVKDVRAYYEEVANQYHEMTDELKDFTELAQNNMFPPEKLEQVEKIIQPLKNNYEMLSYIIFLLNKPTRKKKAKKYEKCQNGIIKNIEKCHTRDGVIETNKNVINELCEKSNS